MKDYLIKAYAFDGTVRIYTAVTTNLVAEAQKIHDLWPTSAAAFGRLLTVSIIMGAMYKNDQELTIRVDGDGPLGGMVTTVNTHGEVRGYVSNPHVFLQYDSGKLNVGKAVGNGVINVTKDLKIRNTFTSSSIIQSGEIGEDFAYYFTVSEQIPSAVGVGVLVGEDNKIITSGGFILQIMPGCSDENISKIEEVIKNLPPVSSLIEKGYTPEDIMNDVSQGDYQLLETLPLHYKCNCTKEKFKKGLLSLGKKQLMTIKAEDHQAEAVCHFCNKKYHFSEDELEELIQKSK